MNNERYVEAVNPVVRLVARLAGAPTPEQRDSIPNEAHDIVGPHPVEYTIVVATSPRTGSTLLMQSLRDARLSRFRLGRSERSMRRR